MNYPEILLIPVFGLADYYLTLVGAVLREKKFGNHYKTEHYELNPVWQKTIAEKKWFNPKLLLLILIETVLFIYITEFLEMSEIQVMFILGFFFVGYGILIGQHLNNILTFWYVIRKPTEISGQVTFNHSLVLSMSNYRQIILLLPLVLILWVEPGPFVMGGVLVTLLMMVTQMVWLLIYRRKQRLSIE